MLMKQVVEYVCFNTSYKTVTSLLLKTNTCSLLYYATEILYECILNVQLFHDGGSYHLETSPLICSANQRAAFYIIETSVTKEVKLPIRGKKDLVQQ